MDLQQRKIHFVQAFLRLNDEHIIDTLEYTLKTEKTKLSPHPSIPYSLDELNQKINSAEEDAKNGRLRNTDELRIDLNTWK
jgi:hypothetical protein